MFKGSRVVYSPLKGPLLLGEVVIASAGEVLYKLLVVRVETLEAVELCAGLFLTGAGFLRSKELNHIDPAMSFSVSSIQVPSYIFQTPEVHALTHPSSGPGLPVQPMECPKVRGHSLPL